MKKALAFLMAVVLLFSLTACSQSELNFYNTMKSLANLDTYSFDGTLTVNINKLEVLKTGVSQQTKQQIEKIKEMFEGKSFLYSGSVDTKNETLSFKMTVKSADGKTGDLMDLQAKDEYLYLSKDFASQLGDVSKEPSETIEGKEYIKIDMKTIVESLFEPLEQSKNSTSNTVDLGELKQSMLKKANAVYLIQLFKTIVLKGADGASTDLLDGFSADLVKKEGDSKYTLHLGNDEISSLLSKVIVYLGSNQEKMTTFEVNFIKSLTDEELVMIGINPNNKDQVIAALQNQTKVTLTTSLPSDTVMVSSGSDTAYASLLSAFDIGYDLTVEKTGSTSYGLSEALSLKPEQEAIQELGMDFDIAISNTLNVNQTAKGDIQTKSDIGEIKSDSASVKLTVSDANAKECGIILSSASDLSDGKKIAGVKQPDGTYTVSLSGLNEDTMYYYKAYTTDASGNQVYSSEVSNFKTMKNSVGTTTTAAPSGETTTTATPVSSPATGESSQAIWYILALCSAAASVSLIKAKRKA